MDKLSLVITMKNGILGWYTPNTEKIIQGYLNHGRNTCLM